MPTRKQLISAWRTQSLFGLSDDEYHCKDYSPESNERNYKSRRRTKFTGPKVGERIYDPKTESQTIIIDNESDLEKKSKD